MSVLLYGVPDEPLAALSLRLIAQDDEVRVLVASGTDDGHLRELGLHVASGTYLDDADLIERASQNVRTLVVGPDLPRPREAHIEAVIRGARAAGVGRLVYFDADPDPDVTEPIKRSGIGYVILAIGRKGLLRRGGVAASDVAEAVDAADDLAGNVELNLDLGSAAGWKLLLLDPR